MTAVIAQKIAEHKTGLLRLTMIAALGTLSTMGDLIPGQGDALAQNAPPLPVKNELPLNAESFCRGMPRVLMRLKQPASAELGQLCNGTTPTSLLVDLIQNPFEGQGNYQYRETGNGLGIGLMPDGDYVRFNVAYSMRVKKSAVSLLLGEEGIIRDPTYANGDGNRDLFVQFKIRDPDLNTPLLTSAQDADIAFLVEQRSVRANGARQFDNRSLHDLKLYSMNENNYDFMVGIRSFIKDLSTPPGEKPLFRKAVVIRAALTDPRDPTSAISLSILSFEVSDQRNQADRVEGIFAAFVNRDMRRVFQFHSARK